MLASDRLAKMPSEQQMRSMRSFRRQSTIDDFVLNQESPLPDIPTGGARIKVCFAGACYTNAQVINSGQKRPRMLGIMDTSLFPGFEVSGTVDGLSDSITDGSVKIGDPVIVYPTDEEESTESGYTEYITVKDASNLVVLPENLPLDLAAMLPCGALAAYAAVQRVKPFILDQLHNNIGFVNILIVGAGGLGLWTLKIAEYEFGSSIDRVRLSVADPSVEKLSIAKQHGCYDVIHCDESQHEEYIVMRMKNVCKGGAHAVIDFVSSVRTVKRSAAILKEGGVLIVGGNAKYEVPICLHTLALRGQSILGVHHGTRTQLHDLVDLVANGQIVPPIYNVFPVDEANQVFQSLSRCRIQGRAVLRVCSMDDDSVFTSPLGSSDRLRQRGSMPGTIPEASELIRVAKTSSVDAAPSSKSAPFFLPHN